MPTSAFPHDHRSFGERTIDVDGAKRPYFEQVFWAGLAGVSLLPATIVPTGPDAQGLPIGVQIIGPEYGDLATHRGRADSRTARLFVPGAAGLLNARPCEAIAEAHPNIALVKYWGKRDGADNVPATPSLSITLSQLRTRTRVRIEPSAGRSRRDAERQGRARREDRRLSRSADCARAAASRRSAHRHRQQFPDRRGPRVVRVRASPR